MFKWNRLFEKEKAKILKMVHTYNGSLIILLDNKAVDKYLEENSSPPDQKIITAEMEELL